MLLLNGLAVDDTVAALLGVDRAEDFEAGGTEHLIARVVVWPAYLAAGRTISALVPPPMLLAS